MSFTFHKKYFLLFLILFAVEITIAVFVRDKFVRPFAGDFLVVILIYCFLKSFFNIPVLAAAVWVFAFACLIEALQALDFVESIGMENNRIASAVLGTYFDWVDILLYFLGVTIVVTIEKLRK